LFAVSHGGSVLYDVLDRKLDRKYKKTLYLPTFHLTPSKEETPLVGGNSARPQLRQKEIFEEAGQGVQELKVDVMSAKIQVGQKVRHPGFKSIGIVVRINGTRVAVDFPGTNGLVDDMCHFRDASDTRPKVPRRKQMCSLNRGDYD
jgi:hypothetical protein